MIVGVKKKISKIFRTHFCIIFVALSTSSTATWLEKNNSFLGGTRKASL